MIAHPSTTLRRMPAATVALILVASLLPSGHVRASATDLFFSEYVEGSSLNKALEIFNGTGAPVDLAAGGYDVQVVFNGGSSTQTLALAGTVVDGDVLVLANPSASAPILEQSDIDNALVVNFNGDDAVLLRKGGEPIDVIGQVGFDPGVVWGTEPITTAEHTLIREPTVAAGDANGSDAFDPAVEWSGLAQNDFSNLGVHTFTPGEPTNPAGSGFANPSSLLPGGSTLLRVEVSPGANPASTGLAVTADLSAIGGAATQPFFDDATHGDLTAGDLAFSYAAAVGPGTSPGVKSLAATIIDAQARTGSATILLTVEAPPTEIWQIQGPGHVSPLNGQIVFDVEGIVTAVSGNSFWMTDPTPDASDATSDGILVFRGTTATKPAVGDQVTVDGRVTEFRPGGAGGFENLALTEITTPNSFAVASSGNPLPVTVVGAGGRTPPATVIDNDTLPAGGGGTGTIDGAGAVTTFDPEQDGIDFYESLEGMYLQVNNALVVGPRNNFGEIAIVGDGGAHAGPFTPRGGLIIGPGDFNPERIILDDVLRTTPQLNVGDGFTTAVTGVLDYSFGNFKLLATTALVGADSGLAREATVAAGAHELAVATFNVENLSAVNPQAKFDELAGMIVHNLRAPDLVAIEEIQDDTGFAVNDGVVTAAATWQRLIDAILAAGGPLYGYRQIDPLNNTDGGQPNGNIRVGFLFRSDRGLEFVDRPGGNAVTDTGAVATPNGKGARLTLSPGRILPDPSGPFATAFEQTRKSLAGEFRWRGEAVFVVVNHLSSKGDDHPLFGRFQPPVRFTEFASGAPEDGWRHAQAQVVNDFVDEILAVDPKANIMVLGDVNDFDFSETVAVLTGVASAAAGGPDLDGSGPVTPTGADAVLTTLFAKLPATERYSYVFEGNSQVLDQILVSTSLWSLNPSYDVVHVNSEFALQASDHDPSVVRIAFQPRRGG
ncbi:MAG: lamin tail domain-containing protein [Candidatus Limnocylindria bacterium]